MAVDLTIALAALLLFIHPFTSLALLALVSLHAIVTEKDDA